MTHQHPRQAFTLIELLVVISIIAILIALLLPAVQQAREAARGLTCRNNLKQLGLAFHNYHVAKNRFPLGAVCAGGNCGGNFRHPDWGTTWAISILPYLEGVNLYDQWNSSLPSDQQPLVTGTPLAVMKCPSELRNPVVIGSANIGTPGEPGRYDRGNYGANYGGGWANEDVGVNGFSGSVSWTNSPNRGVFSSRQSGDRPYGAAIADIQDGTSNTLMLAEILTRVSNWDCRGCWGRNMGAIFSAYTGHVPDDGPEGIAGPNVPAVGNFRDFPVYCGNGTRPETACEDESDDGRGGVAARSLHPAGVNVLFCDGSTTFVKETIDRVVWRSLITIQGCEVVDEF